MIIKIIFCSNKKRKCPKSLCPEPFEAQIAEDMVMLYQDSIKTISDKPHLLTVPRKKAPPLPKCFFLFLMDELYI